MNHKIPTLMERLSQLESHLQTLVEGSAARLFNHHGLAAQLPIQAVEALKAGLRSNPEGELLAPNRFTLIVHPRRQSELDQPDLLQDLAKSIQLAAEQAGARFLAPLDLQCAVDPEAPLQQVRVYAMLSPEHLATTSSLVEELNGHNEPLPNQAFLIVDGTHTIPLDRTVINIGRRPDNQLVITDSRVSRVHAQLRAIHGRYVIFDLNSTGGTFVNEQRISQHPLSAGDVISLAGVPLVYGQEQPSLEGTQRLDLG